MEVIYITYDQRTNCKKKILSLLFPQRKFGTTQNLDYKEEHIEKPKASFHQVQF